ncbi:MAG: SAM-dependent DNA methyltransferase [Blastocatellales bacterium]
MPQRSKAKVEFGDFQTPAELANRCCALLAESELAPASIVEPTCGRGNFLAAALKTFPEATSVIGLEINPAHVEAARQQVQNLGEANRTVIHQEDFFRANWPEILNLLPDPLLIIGNPPWVTNSRIGSIEGGNLPRKSNFQNLAGLDALTGKSNFDISEWMLLRALELINGRQAVLAVLCKTSTARKVLSYAWQRTFQIARATLYRVDAEKHFGAAVDACWLVVEMSRDGRSVECNDHSELSLNAPSRSFGFRNDRLIADLSAYDDWKHLIAEKPFAWRSGVKHDCAKLIELERDGSYFRNGLGEKIELEPDYLYPMLKSSEVAAESEIVPHRWMIVTQQSVGEETRTIRHLAPKTWRYLLDHADMLDSRASSIYKNRPRFSVFGVGSYSFAPWKVGISGFYKKLSFRVIAPHQGKPVVLDDTCYFLACGNQAEAETIARLLNSEPARLFLSAFVFWDAKRPITVDLLRQIDLVALARLLGEDKRLIETLMELRSGRKLIEQTSLFSE